MLINLLACAAGLILLAWSADRFVYGAASIARLLGAPPMLVGLTIIGIGTSAPEMVVSLTATLGGTPQLAIGNALGSNITNFALVLGLTAMITPLAVDSAILRRELPLVLGVTAATFLLCIDGRLQRWDGGLLLLGFVLTLLWMARLATSSDADDRLVQEIEQETSGSTATKAHAWGWVAVGMVLLPISSQILVWGAVNIATILGVSELVIGLTIVAIGTSLPELAASLAGARRGEPELVIGNVLGSNLFNLLLVLGIPAALVAPEIASATLHRDFPLVIGLTVVVFIMARGRNGPGEISRAEGAALLTVFVGYQLILGATVLRP